ncbi:oocyte zinc finger protein XlCOF7.1-like [Mytilus trossulus]|uniref:oocyte zinc finger protein XlCOF7.1-like n=1 Tax=Mytilus trossulus TaxID=6551 RepID=UPI00300517A8
MSLTPIKEGEDESRPSTITPQLFLPKLRKPTNDPQTPLVSSDVLKSNTIKVQEISNASKDTPLDDIFRSTSQKVPAQRKAPIINEQSHSSKTATTMAVNSTPAPVPLAKITPTQARAQSKKFKCIQCNMCYVRRAYLIKHVMGKHGTQNCCLKCMQIFNTEKEYNQHVLNFHSRFYCDVCGGAYANKFELKRHVDSHRDRKDRLFKCPFTNCSYSHDRFTCFEYHINKHRKKKPFCCGKCSKEFSSRYMFNRHVQICIGDFGKCPKCEREFGNDSMLYDHIQTCHLEKIFACPECDKTYKWRASLSRHLTLNH